VRGSPPSERSLLQRHQRRGAIVPGAGARLCAVKTNWRVPGVKDPTGVAVATRDPGVGLVRSGAIAPSFEERGDRVVQVGSPIVLLEAELVPFWYFVEDSSSIVTS
jgi:hypothetical protein